MRKPSLATLLFLLLIAPGSWANSPNEPGKTRFATPSGLFPLATQTALWDPLIDSQRGQWIENAEAIAAEVPVEWSDERYLDYSRTGEREGFQQNRILRERRFYRLFLGVLATGAEGSWIPELEATILDLTNEPTWAYSAHDPDLKSFRGESQLVDLGVAMRAFDLACAIDILHDKLDPALIAKVEAAIRQRVFEPYLRAVSSGRTEPAEIWWLETTNNWNAVCHFGVISAALILERDAERRATFLKGMQRFLPAYLSGFSDDGYCAEGLSYWNYGFTQYVALAELVLRGTSGRLDLLDHPRVEAIALYPYRLRLTPEVYPIFADGGLNSKPNPALTAYLSKRLPSLRPFIKAPNEAIAKGGHIAVLCFGFSSSPEVFESEAESKVDPLRSLFPQGGVLVSRAGKTDARTAVAVKGGHNGEHHNHNDVGTFVVTVDGVPLIIDPGKEIYSQRTFGDQRYESQVLSSFGHSVPVVAGQLQAVGREFRGRILETKFTDASDRIRLDLREAYAVESLLRLEREVTHHRVNGGSVEMVDTVEFESPQSFSETFITLGTFRKIDAHHGIIEDEGKAVEIRWRAAAGEFEFSTGEIEENLPGGIRPLRLQLKSSQPVTTERIAISLRPLEHLPARSLTRIKTSEKAVALTFDDGPEELSLQLIDLLEGNDAKATFFVVGNKLEDEANAAILRRIAAGGHEIGNHSLTHAHLPELAAAEIKNELRRTQMLIKAVTGQAPTLFRAPYLEYNGDLMSFLGEEELVAVNASNSVRDWHPETTVEDIIERGANTATPGAIVLMHSWSEKTLEALPEVIRILKDKGYRMVTVSELLELELRD